MAIILIQAETCIKFTLCAEAVVQRRPVKKMFLLKQPPEVFGKKAVLRNFAKFTRKHLCQSLFFNKVTGLQLYYKRDSGTGVFLPILRYLQKYVAASVCNLSATIKKSLTEQINRLVYI